MSDFKIIIGNKNYSSWSLRGWLALAAYDIPFEEIMLPLDTPEFYERIAKLNPSGKVPALYHGDLLIWDSLAIIDYIAKLYPEKNIWPKDNAAYAFARSISAEMHAGFTAVRGAMPMNMQGAWSGLGTTDAVEADIRRIEELWTYALDSFSGDGPYLFGNTLSGADIMFSAVVSRFKTYDIKLNERCSAYSTSVLDHPAVKVWTEAALKETDIVEVDEIDPNTSILGS